MTLSEYQTAVGAWSAKNFGNQPSYRPLLGVAEEVGELCHAHLKAEQGIRVNEDHFAAKCDAVGDIIIYLCDYCAHEGISLEVALATAWEEVSARDWTKHKEKGTNEPRS